MRVTNKMLITTVMTNVNRNLNSLSQLQEQLSSGKNVSRPSHDPAATARILTLEGARAQEQQYRQNMEDAQGFLDASDSALQHVLTDLQRLRELALSADGSKAPGDLKAIANEVGQLKQELLQVANSNYGGRYLFGGYFTRQAPFQTDGSYLGDNGALNWEVAQGVTMAVNVSGQEAFVDSGALSVFDDALVDLNAGSPVSGTVLNSLDVAVDKVLEITASLGARSRRMELAGDRSWDTELNLTALLSRVEDIDVAKTVMDYRAVEAAYQASLATSAQILQPTLLDYLR